MTKILAFKSRPALARTGNAPHGGAVIVIFPGVRYERLENDPRQTPKAPTRARSPVNKRRQG